MSPDLRSRVAKLAANRPLQILTVLAAVAASASAAAPLAPQQVQSVAAAVAQIAAPPAPAPQLKLVWEGRDIDGDGRADFANPTGQAPRGHDVYGEGEF